MNSRLSTLAKTGRLDFSHREHKGEVKAWQGDFEQLHRDMFLQKKCVVSSHLFFLKLHLKCAFDIILLINSKFTFCTCIIVGDLIFFDFQFYSFNWLQNIVCEKLKFNMKYMGKCELTVHLKFTYYFWFLNIYYRRYSTTRVGRGNSGTMGKRNMDGGIC